MKWSESLSAVLQRLEVVEIMILQRGNTELVFFCQQPTPVEQHSPKKGFSFVEKGSRMINSDFALQVCYPEATSDQKKIFLF